MTAEVRLKFSSRKEVVLTMEEFNELKEFLKDPVIINTPWIGPLKMPYNDYGTGNTGNITITTSDVQK